MQIYKVIIKSKSEKHRSVKFDFFVFIIHFRRVCGAVLKKSLEESNVNFEDGITPGALQPHLSSIRLEAVGNCALKIDVDFRNSDTVDSVKHCFLLHEY